MDDGKKGGRLAPALVLLILFGLVSLFSDMTHEGAASIRGAYMSLIGASAGVIGFVSGLGELAGYSLRYVFGRLADRTGKYWTLTVAGYVIDVLAVPALALVGEDGWFWACMLLVVQRLGKAVKKPAKDTIMSFAASQLGAGKSFGLQELLDQIGAFAGPVLLYLVMLARTGGDAFHTYALCFAVLAVPGAITIALLLATRRKFPNPEDFEPAPKEHVPLRMSAGFVLYIAGISCFAFGFIDYALIVMHVSHVHADLAQETLPLIYAGAMLVDAVAAVVFGYLYDRIGVVSLMASTLLSSVFAVFVFAMDSVPALLVGVVLWSIGMGAQESVLKAAVTSIVPKDSRATGYGIFECSFGIFWFLGSWLTGVLYEVSIPAMVAVSASAQLAAIVLFACSARSGARNG